jgi:lipopolysaccharide transport system permease protein
MQKEFEQPVIYLRPRKGWQSIPWKELVQYRDLLYFLSIRGIKAKYAQSILGIAWAIIQPLFSTLVFTIVFGNLAKISSEGVPYFLFSLVAMVPWNYFSGTLAESSNSLVTNSAMISKVYFPRLVLPLSAAISKLLDFLIGAVMMIVFLLVYQLMPSWEIVFLPLLILILLMASLGFGMFLSAMAVQYRDVKHAITFAVQLLMYVAPVVYPTSNVPIKYQTLYALNPMVGVIEGFRSIFLSTQPFPWLWAAEGLSVSLLVFFVGAVYFSKMEKNFADVA